MSALGLETVLVGDVVDGVGNAIIADVAVEAADGDRVGLGVWHVLQFGVLLLADAVALLDAASEQKRRDFVRKTLSMT